MFVDLPRHDVDSCGRKKEPYKKKTFVLCAFEDKSQFV